MTSAPRPNLLAVLADQLRASSVGYSGEESLLNDIPRTTAETSIGHVFAREGYDTAWNGKWHLNGADRPVWALLGAPRQGFEFWAAEISCMAGARVRRVLNQSPWATAPAQTHIWVHEQ